MPNHQRRRESLPPAYQFPTHGVDCDCPPCRDRVVTLGPSSAVTITLPLPPDEPTSDTPWGV